MPRPAGGTVFSDRIRRAGFVWVGVALVLTGVAARRIDRPETFLIVMPLTSGLLTLPAVAAAAVAARRVRGPLRRFWRWYFAGNAVFYVVGAGIVGYGIDHRPQYIVLTLVALAVALVFDALAIDQVIGARSGARSRSVDLVESGLAIVMVTAPVVVVKGDQILGSRWAWFAVVTVACLVLFVSALWCAVVLFVRSPRGTRQAAGVAIVLGVVAVLASVVQVEQVVSGFALPHLPLLVFTELCMGLLLLIPLHARRGQERGLERLPPQAQIRTGRVVAAVTFAALPLTGGAVVLAGTTPTAVRTAAAALALLVVLSAARQLLTYSETRRLYAEVERSAEDRRALLAAVLESLDAERRRVAMQLHEQASSSYAALASLVPSDGRDAPRPGDWSAPLRPLPSRPLSHLLTERMAAQAESLRELIGAIRPMASSDETGLAPILHAYVDSLDDGVRPPSTRVKVAEDLRLDWITETVVLRVVQEAVRNTCRHADATNLRIVLSVEDDVAVVRVTDDGCGFDVDGLVVESGIATMRRFVSFCHGELRIHSTWGEGTLVEARLGGSCPQVVPPPRLRPVN